MYRLQGTLISKLGYYTYVIQLKTILFKNSMRLLEERVSRMAEETVKREVDACHVNNVKTLDSDRR